MKQETLIKEVEYHLKVYEQYLKTLKEQKSKVEDNSMDCIKKT